MRWCLAVAIVAYPPKTENYHHEVELVVAIATGGQDIPVGKALDHVFGYAIGFDMTRRDLQFLAKEKKQPWEMGKGVGIRAGRLAQFVRWQRAAILRRAPSG